jgi:hypothetical protein
MACGYWLILPTRRDLMSFKELVAADRTTGVLRANL